MFNTVVTATPPGDILTTTPFDSIDIILPITEAGTPVLIGVRVGNTAVAVNVAIIGVLDAMGAAVFVANGVSDGTTTVGVSGRTAATFALVFPWILPPNPPNNTKIMILTKISPPVMANPLTELGRTPR